MDLLLRSITVSFGAAAIAVFLASILALATFGRRSLASRWQSGLVTSFLLLPTYVVAGAWSAGFGSMGWWTLSQVTAAKAPLVGVASVVWIHAMAATPVAYWLLVLGMRRCRSAPIQLARMEGGTIEQFVRGIWPSWSTWVVGSFLVIAAWVSTDMVVTNLFQVPTLVEQCYLDMLADQATWSRTVTASSMSLVLGFASFCIIRKAWRREQPIRQAGSWNEVALGRHWIGSIVAWFIVVLVVAIPLTNLTIKAGWNPKQTDIGTIERSWNPWSVIENVLRVPFDFLREFQWSLSLASWSATIACVTATVVILIAMPRIGGRAAEGTTDDRPDHSLVRAIVFAVLIAGFALPGPIVSAIVIRFFQLPIPGFLWLNDHTLAAPILCLQFRMVPMAALTFEIFRRQWREHFGDLWRIDAGRRWTARARVYGLAFAKPTFVLWIVLFAVGFGDLSSYLQCLPPGVTPVAMRIFDLLHYGVRASEAGLLLFICILGISIGVWVNRKQYNDSR